MTKTYAKLASQKESEVNNKTLWKWVKKMTEIVVEKVEKEEKTKNKGEGKINKNFKMDTDI